MVIKLKTITLSPRLEAVASYIMRGARAADVGTDHGYVPVYLAQRGLASYILASDVRRGPLETAIENAKAYGAGDKIEFRLSDGLSGMEDDRLDTVILAGLGGENIAAILSRAPWAVNGASLILQPQSKLPELSDFLTERGVYIKDARLALDAGRIYLTFKAARGGGKAPTEAEKYAPGMLLENRDRLLPEYLDGLISKLSRALSGMERSEHGKSGAKYRTAIAGLKEMKEECEKWQA